MTRAFHSVWTAVLFGASVTATAAGAADKAGELPVATPPGITLQRAGELNARGTNANAGQGALSFITAMGRRMVFADSDGRTLYTSDKDTAGKSTCTAECAKAWPPAMAPKNAQTGGDWSAIARDDGSKQWAYRGKPLYRSALDTAPAELKGDNAEGGLGHKASYNLAAGESLPFGLITVAEIAEANGQGLIDADGRTLYTLDGDDDRQAACDELCDHEFVPFEASQLIRPVGSFTIIDRPDGLRQWAYRGKLLYTYAGDAIRGDASGMGIDKRWKVALVDRYFMPSLVKIEPTIRGLLLADAKGQILYRHDSFVRNPGGVTNLHRAIVPRPGVGREIGWQSCTAEYLKDWQPLRAAADATPSGYWEIVARDDGTR